MTVTKIMRTGAIVRILGPGNILKETFETEQAPNYRTDFYRGVAFCPEAEVTDLREEVYCRETAAATKPDAIRLINNCLSCY